MTFTPTAISRCAGLNHVTVTFSVNGNSRTETFLRSELDLDPDDLRAAVITRLRSAVKEAGASSAAAIQTALVNKTFQV